MEKAKKKALIKNAAIAAMLVTLSVSSYASGTGSGGGTFIQPLYEFLKSSMTGWVGTSIAIGGLAYGLIAGIARGSIAGLGTGVGLGIGAVYGPQVIEQLATAII